MIKKTNQIWLNESGCSGYFANGCSNSRGVGILINGKFQKEIKSVIRDVNGRYLILSVEINGMSYCIANIYAPNEDKPLFFKEVSDKIASLECMFVVLGGDFNVVMDSSIDRNVDRIYNPQSHQAVSQMMDSLNLIDVWRVKHPDTKKFTWCRRVSGELRWSRIDYFLVSEELYGKVVHNTISPAILSDHSLIELEIDSGVPKRGKGVWKLNESILNDDIAVEKISNHLEKVIQQYKHLDGFQYWELIKHEAIRICQDISKDKSMARNDYKLQLYMILESVQDKMIAEPNNGDLISSERTVKTDIDVMATEDAKRAAFRCRKNWNIYGEKGSKFFFGLEKRMAVNKTMYVVRKSNGELTKDYREILNVQKDYFEKLYSEDHSSQFNMANTTTAVFSEQARLLLDADITVDEIFDAIMTLKSGKTPGLDGLGIGFYRKFWNILKLPLLQLYQQAMMKGSLNPSARKGLVNLIPKKSADEFAVKSWRPLMILGYDYKIYAKLLSNRMDMVTSEIIGPQQYGFLKGRSAMSSVRRTIEVVTYLKKTKTPGLVAIVDFEKAFDKISYSAIRGMLKYFGANDKFVNMLFLLFNNFTACTQSNGYLSPFFNKCRGVNQGCPASPTCFVWTGELLAHLINSNKDIVGISVNGLEALLAQFADDTSSYLKYDELVVKSFYDTLRCVEANTGLTISYDKTALYRVGSIRNTNAKFYSVENVNWSNDPIKTLGIAVNCDGSSANDNWEGLLRKVQNVCDIWYNRSLTLVGRVLVVNTLVSSLCVYKMSIVMDLTQDQVKTLNEVVYKFIWKGKRARISMYTLSKKKNQGGLKLVDFRLKQDALLIAWIPKLDSDVFLAKCAYTALSPVLQNIIWKCNISSDDVVKLYGDNYWASVLKAWSKLKFHCPESRVQVMFQIIWSNSYIRIGGLPVVWKDLYDCGILFVHDLFNDTGPLKKIHDFNNILQKHWLHVASLQNALPKRWIELMSMSDWGEEKPDPLDSVYDKKGCSLVYNLMLEDSDALRKYCDRWLSEIPDLSYENFCQAFVRHSRCRCAVKYWDFQYRLMLKKIVTNADLCDWKLVNSATCTFLPV